RDPLVTGVQTCALPISPALRDRMEVIEIPGYTDREKLEIARRYLVQRQLKEQGLKEKALAALRAGERTVLIPKLNEKDLADLPEIGRASCRERGRLTVP